MTTIGREHSFVVIRRPDSGPPFAEGPNVRELLKAGDASTPTLAGRISALGLDLYHSVHHFLPIGLRAPRIVVTLHDLIWLEHPQLIRGGPLAPLTRPVTHLYARAAIGHAVARADRVIAISAYTAARAQAYFGLAPSRLDVVHHGVAHEKFHPPDRPPAPRLRYFLCVGNSKPYKNLATAVRAFALCASDLPDVQLFVAGRGDGQTELARIARELGIAARVRSAATRRCRRWSIFCTVRSRWSFRRWSKASACRSSKRWLQDVRSWPPTARRRRSERERRAAVRPPLPAAFAAAMRRLASDDAAAADSAAPRNRTGGGVHLAALRGADPGGL